MAHKGSPTDVLPKAGINHKTTFFLFEMISSKLGIYSVKFNFFRKPCQEKPWWHIQSLRKEKEGNERSRGEGD